MQESEDTLAEPDDVRHAGPLSAQEDDHVLIDREFRRADKDTAIAADRTAWNAELHRRAERAFQIDVDLERDERLDRAPIVAPLRVDGGNAAARDRPRLPREIAEIGGQDHSRVQCSRSKNDDNRRANEHSHVKLP